MMKLIESVFVQLTWYSSFFSRWSVEPISIPLLSVDRSIRSSFNFLCSGNALQSGGVSVRQLVFAQLVVPLFLPLVEQDITLFFSRVDKCVCFLFFWSSLTSVQQLYFGITRRSLLRSAQEGATLVSAIGGRGHLLRLMRGEVYYGQCTVRFVELIMPFLHG